MCSHRRRHSSPRTSPHTRRRAMVSDMLQGLILGCFIGFVAGYFTNHLRRIEKGVDEVKTSLTGDAATPAKPPKAPARRDEKGFMRKPIVHDVAYLAALLLILVGLYQMNQITKRIEEQAQADLVSRC